MAVAYDAASSVATNQTSVASFSWTHTPVGTPQCAVVITGTTLASSKITSVTYGGTGMTLIGSGIDTDTEPYTLELWFLDNVPSGAQTVLVNRTNDATQTRASCLTLTAGTNTECYTAGMKTRGGTTTATGGNASGTGTFAGEEVTVDDGSPGTNSLRVGAYYYGGATPLTAGANSTARQSIDQGAYGYTVLTETTAGQGARSIGVTAGTADDAAAIYVAVREYTPAAATFPGWCVTMGGWF